MTDVFDDFSARVRAALERSFPDLDGSILERVGVEPPRDPSHGDLATNAAMVLAKPLKTKPRDIADALVAELEKDPDIDAPEIAGPGFVNMRLAAGFWQSELARMLEQGARYGSGSMEEVPVNVEYVSANPTGPMHVGHCRGAVVGDTLANLLSFSGQKVTREYYVNDAGGQIDVLVDSVIFRMREKAGTARGPVPDGLYPGEYLVPVAAQLLDQHGAGILEGSRAELRAAVRPAVIEAMLTLIRDDLQLLGVHHDVFFSEATLHGDGGNASAIQETVDALQARDLVYVGRLPPPKGEKPEGWEDREQLLLRSTQVGDDIDRPLAKASGEWTYFAADVAYFADKYRRGFKEMIFILGADHAGYVKRLQAVARAIAGDDAKLTVRLCQLVKLFRDGTPITMGKRSGNFVTLREVVDEVGRDAVRFMMLYRKNDAPLDFDFAKVTEQSKDNPVFYVQYAHARCRSVFRQAGRDVPAEFDGALLTDPGELGLIRKIAEWPRVVNGAATSHEPHRVAFYLYDLASAFHQHWARGNGDPSLRFVNDDDPKTTAARLALTRAVENVLACGLGLVGASAPQEMR